MSQYFGAYFGDSSTAGGGGGTFTDPGVGNVRLGVAYTFNSVEMAGTLALPAAADVREGVPYGAGGVEYVGTFGAAAGDDWLVDTLAADWAVFDTPRTVVLRARSAVTGGTDVLTTITAVQREATTVDDLAFAPALANANSTSFNIWRSRLGASPSPRKDDVIDDGSVRWKIELVQVLDEEQRYRCVCIRVR
jgi:hypothetical protein